MYPTKVDWWIGLILAFSVAVLISSAIPFLTGRAAQMPLGLGFGIFCLATAIWLAWIPFNTRYEIDEGDLVVRSSGFRWRIQLDSIDEVFPTRNPLSSPALSLDRLRVNYQSWNGRARYVLISPREKDAFVRDLAAATNLEFDGERLMRGS